MNYVIELVWIGGADEIEASWLVTVNPKYGPSQHSKFLNSTHKGWFVVELEL